MIAPRYHEEDEYSRELDLALWRKLFAYTRPYRRAVVWICVAGVVTAFADTAYPLLTRAVTFTLPVTSARELKTLMMSPLFSCSLRASATEISQAGASFTLLTTSRFQNWE